MDDGHDPLYGSEVDEGTGLFPTSEILRPFFDSPSTSTAPVTDNGDIRSSVDYDGASPPEDQLDPALIDEYEALKPLNDLSQINDRKVILPPPPV